MTRHTRKRLLGVGTDSKTIKGESQGILTGILYLTPSDLSGKWNLCRFASDGCRKACLNSAGRGAFSNVQKARLAKTTLLFENRPAFLWNLSKDIEALERKAERLEMTPAIRLNGTSDVLWERVHPELFQSFSHLTFYDYTKHPGRTTPDNYHLTFSRSESNAEDTGRELARGINAAVVFGIKKGRPLPDRFRGYEVLDGDLSDCRFLDKGTGPGPYVIGLRAKGKAINDYSGFVIHPDTLTEKLRAMRADRARLASMKKGMIWYEIDGENYETWGTTS